MTSNPSQTRPINAKALLLAFIGLLLLAGFVWLVVFILIKLFSTFGGVSPTIVTAATTVLVATFTVVAGRYFEHKRETDVAYREQKLAIYDDFLKVLFKILLETDPQASTEADPDVVKFLREHHRKLILWTGPKGLAAYSDWYRTLRVNAQSAQTILKMEKFFLALRSDLGHSNRGLKEGDILHLILNDTDLLLQASKARPDVSLEEISALKKLLEKSE